MNKLKNGEYLGIYNNYKNMMVVVTSNIVAYPTGWSDEFSRSEITSLYQQLITEFNNIDFKQFSTDELKSLGFKWFDDDLICMPVWVLDCLPDKTEMSSISGDIIIFDKSSGLDKDVRFGVTAYGFLKSQLRDSRIEEVLSK